MSSTPPPRDPVFAELAATYTVFRDAQPLAIGIHKSVMAAHPGLDKDAVRKALQRHTASTRYLKAVAAGGARYGLDGAASGEVTPEQKKLAADSLRERFRKQAEQRREAEKAKEIQAKLHQLVEKFR
ncbi:MAG: ProQ/FinO family protein [Sulfuritalea sp.]|nr:ProQ/FinO family protein [Sulfuritalea sp.]